MTNINIMLSSGVISELFSYKKLFVRKETMHDFYRRNNAPTEILSLVKLENKQFGTMMEHIITEYIGMKPPKQPITSYDRLFENNGRSVRIEIKSSRLWRRGPTSQFKWQHIMKDHDYDVLLLAGLDFACIRLYAISKKQIMELYWKGGIKQQGCAEGQGLWFSFSQIKPYITDIGSKERMIAFCSGIE